jgi:hypothetical protein
MGVLNGRRNPRVPREKERIGGTYVDENRDAACRIVPSPPSVIIASTVLCNSAWIARHQKPRKEIPLSGGVNANGKLSLTSSATPGSTIIFTG